MRVLFIVLLLLLPGAGAVYTTLAAGPNFGILFNLLVDNPNGGTSVGGIQFIERAD
jgi:hypothetical protein